MSIFDVSNSTDFFPRYFKRAVNASLFVAAQTAGTALIAKTTGGTTLQLYNPPASGVNMVVVDCVVTVEANTAITQQVSIYICGAAMGATQTITTPLTPLPSLVGSSVTAQGGAAVSTTFSNAAIPLRYISSLAMAATATTGVNSLTAERDEIAGTLVIPPGSYIGIYGLTGGTIGDVTIAASFSWVELPTGVL
jgi:hypothetical protein